MSTISIVLSLIALVLTIMNILSSHILKEPPIIREVTDSIDSNKCVSCSSQSQCLLKYHLIMGGKKMFEKIIKIQPIIIGFSVLSLIALIGMVAYKVFMTNTEAQADANGVFFLFVVIQLLLITIPLLCYMYVRFYCFIFKNIGD